MNKVKIKLIILGQLPVDLDKARLAEWKSDVFEISGLIDCCAVANSFYGDDHKFTDKNIEACLPAVFEGDFLVAMTNAPLEDDIYSRILANNRVCMTFYQMAEILRQHNIPLENLVLRLLYTYTLTYRRNGDNILTKDKLSTSVHEETRGCLFDMDVIKTDIVYSLNNPVVCNDCVERLIDEKVSVVVIDKVRKEIKRIRKGVYYRIADWVKRYPIWMLLISTVTALLIGVIGSLIASLIWEKIIN